jgi:hypothetical protein
VQSIAVDDPRPRTSTWPVRRSLSSGARALLSGPPHVDLERAVHLLGAHGSDLLRLARLITGSRQVARKVVLAVIVQASTQPVHVDDCADEETRRVLAGLVFVACWTDGPGVRATLSKPAQARSAQGWSHSGCQSMRWLASTSAQQRAALALYLDGAHTPHQAGALLDVPHPAMCELLVAGLKDLITTSGRP